MAAAIQRLDRGACTASASIRQPLLGCLDGKGGGKMLASSLLVISYQLGLSSHLQRNLQSLGGTI